MILRVRTENGELLRVGNTNGEKAEIEVEEEFFNLHGLSAEDVVDAPVEMEGEEYQTIKRWCQQAMNMGIMAYVEVE